MAPSSNKDYYTVLGVEQTATPALITRAYVRLTLKLHPYRYTTQEAITKFELLSEAYDTLKNPNSRRTYNKIYPSIKKAQAVQPRVTPNVPPDGPIAEEVQLVEMREKHQEYEAQMLFERRPLDVEIFALRLEVPALEKYVEELDRVAGKEAAEEALREAVEENSSTMGEPNDFEQSQLERRRRDRAMERERKSKRLAAAKEDLAVTKKKLEKQKGKFAQWEARYKAARRSHNHQAQALDSLQHNRQVEGTRKREEQQLQEQDQRDREEIEQRSAQRRLIKRGRRVRQVKKSWQLRMLREARETEKNPIFRPAHGGFEARWCPACGDKFLRGDARQVRTCCACDAEMVSWYQCPNCQVMVCYPCSLGFRI